MWSRSFGVVKAFLIAGVLGTWAFSAAPSSAVSDKVDFRRDVQPLALNQAGALPSTHPAYKRGIEFLMKTRLGDGSWYVKTRAIPLQPFFESGFPYGPDQWISAAATNWAAMALALSAGG